MKRKKSKKSTRRPSRRSSAPVAFVANPAPRRRRRKPPHNWKRGKAYSWNPRRRSFRRNPGLGKFMAPVVDVLAGLGGAIGGAKIISILPVSMLVQNLTMITVGLLTMVFGRKWTPVKYGGFGLALAGGTRQVLNMVPMLAGENELTQDQAYALLGALAEDGSEMEGEGDYTDAELVSGPMNGPMNGPLDGEMNPFNMNG